MTLPDAGRAKAALRQHHLDRRAGRPLHEREGDAADVAAALLRGLRRVRAFAAYVPEETEPGHGRIPAAFTQLGARVLLPVMPQEGRELAWAVDTGRLQPGRDGVLEPIGPRLGPTAIGTADVVVLPALAVDRRGVRLGRGGGFYDRALQHVRPGAVLVAVVFDDEFLEEIPVEPHDRLVTAVVTPSGGWQALPASS